MLFAFLLGLTGSLGHCVGMCGSVTLLINRPRMASGWRLLVVHLGRVTTYSLLGLMAGALGHTAELALPGLQQLQGVLALLAAGLAVYLALALLGWMPSPEVYLVGLIRCWSQAMRRLTVRARPGDSQQATTGGPWSAVAFGLLWGLLPCGLVWTALLPAAATGSPGRGALSMLTFGLGTWPALLGMGWALGRGAPRPGLWPRQVAALVVLLFSAQMALRGLAAWGWVSHLRVGGVMVW